MSDSKAWDLGKKAAVENALQYAPVPLAKPPEIQLIPEKPFRLEMSHASLIAVVSLFWAMAIIGALVLGFAISQIRPMGGL